MTIYKRLGDYIKEVDSRNRDLKVTKLAGLTINKAFIPSVANVIGTDLSNYKIIRKEQFACSLMQVSRDGKMPVAMFEEDAAIMSPAYPMFEVIDKAILLPPYLMMWFSRSEFDREASYYAVGGVRGSLTWEDFCNMMLPIPTIDRQREIVEEYETLSRHIRLNEQMIEKLEATAQALYRKTFVDNIDKENLPEGWRIGTLGEIANCLDYKRRPLSEDERKPIKGIYPYYGAMSVVDHINQYIFDGTFLLFSEDGVNVIDKFGHPALQYLWGKFWVNNHAHVLQGNEVVSTEYLYLALKDVNATHLVTGAAQPKINQENMNSILLVVPSKEVMDEFNRQTPSRSQLLVTTHNDGLLDLVDDLIRKDSVWFTEKDKAGVTDLYKLTDFRGVNRLSSIREAYRNKRFGATMK